MILDKIRQTIFDSFPNPLGWLLLLSFAFVKRICLLAFSSGLDVRQMSTQEKRATAERFKLLWKYFAALNLILLVIILTKCKNLCCKFIFPWSVNLTQGCFCRQYKFPLKCKLTKDLVWLFREFCNYKYRALWPWEYPLPTWVTSCARLDTER